MAQVDLVPAMVHSMNIHGKSQKDFVLCEMIGKVGDNDYLVKTPAGVICHALFNGFVCLYYADDIYRVEEA